MHRPMTALPTPTRRPADHVSRLRVTLADGRGTTVHVSRYDAATTDLKVALVGNQRLAAWCAAQGIAEAMVGGFFVRPGGVPLGELRLGGVKRPSVAFTAPWDGERACVHIEGRTVRILPRGELPAAPRGDLLQAGPLLVRDGRRVYDRAADPEGFSAGAAQFDSDITAARHPRAALARSGDSLYAVVCDGRSEQDAGLTLDELADVLVGLGADAALNLDGGGSTTLIAGGVLRNEPYADQDVPEPGGRGIATALLFLPADPS